MIEEQIAQDDIPGAIAFLDKQMGEDGALRGTVEGTELQGKVLAVRQEYAGRAAFKDILSTAGSSAPKDLIPHLIKLQAQDPILGASTWKAYATLNKMQTAERTAKRLDSVKYLIKHFSGGGTLANAASEHIDVLAQEVPQMLTPAAQQKAVEASVRAEERQRHVDLGGSVKGSSQITADFKRMGDEDPEGLSKLFETQVSRDRVRALVSSDQFAELTIAAQNAKEAYSKIVGAATKDYGTLLKDLGFKPDSTKHEDLLVDSQLRERVTNEKLAFHKKNGREMRDEELMPMIAQHVLTIRNKTNEYFDDYSMYALSELDKQGGKDVSTLKLQAETNTDLLNIARIYGVSKADVKVAIEGIEGKSGPRSARTVTLNTLDIQLRKTRQSFTQANAAQEALRDASIAAGYNYDFMEWAAQNGAGGATLNNNVLSALDAAFKADPNLYAVQYKRWIDGK